jgi:hypothetical protein
MKPQWGSSVTALLIPNLDTRHRWVDSFKPQPIYSQERNPVRMKFWLSRQQNRSGRFWDEKISCPCRDFNPELSIHSQLSSSVGGQWYPPIWNTITSVFFTPVAKTIPNFEDPNFIFKSNVISLHEDHCSSWNKLVALLSLWRLR